MQQLWMEQRCCEPRAETKSLDCAPNMQVMPWQEKEDRMERDKTYLFVWKCNFINGYVIPNHFHILHSF